MLVNHCQSGERRVGYLVMILEAGSSGIADIIWAEGLKMKIRDKSRDGR